MRDLGVKSELKNIKQRISCEFRRIRQLIKAKHISDPVMIGFRLRYTLVDQFIINLLAQSSYTKPCHFYIYSDYIILFRDLIGEDKVTFEIEEKY